MLKSRSMKRTTLSGNITKQNPLAYLRSLSIFRPAVITEIISLLLVILFLYTGISKLTEYVTFKAQISQSPVLKYIAPVLAWALPITELIVAILLFIPRYRLIGFYSSFILMISFTGYVIAILTTSEELPCSCGGVLEQLSWQGHLVFNSIFSLLAFTGIFLTRRSMRTPA